MAVDVAREGLVERLRALRWERVRAGLALTAGWIMVFPQGLVAAALGQFDGVPPSWFVALHVGGDELWLVAGAMVGVGLVLVDHGLHALGKACEARRRTASR